MYMKKELCIKLVIYKNLMVSVTVHVTQYFRRYWQTVIF